MTPERYHRLGEIFNKALELPPGERVSYLKRACDGDADLLREVEALLANHSHSETFLSRPAIDVAAQLVPQKQTPFASGKQISHYRILSPIGAGGMGEVYLAEDIRLKRKVALKVLPASIGDDEERLRRFEQEAFAASSLNHPNILTIYEFAPDGEIHFLATEFVDGETVRSCLKRGPMSLGKSLDVSVQTTQALAAAHEAGIVHRDIKPENVMVRKDGLVKVLDFGLAKLVAPTPLDSEAQTRMQTLTQAGTILGTAAYMSPEQARGETVDARTDVFSLGVFLYEMISHRHPFMGQTISHTLVAIIEKDPPWLSQVVKGVPVELEQIVHRCLEKKTEDRYANASELLADLKRLQKNLEMGDQFTRPASPQQSSQEPTLIPQNKTNENIVQPTIISPQSSPAVTRRSRLFWLLPGLALVIIAGVAVWQWPHPAPVNPAANVTTALPERNLTYSLTVQRYRDGKPYQSPFSSSGREIFESGWRFRLNLTNSQDGFLYLINLERNGQYRLLFPLPSNNGGSAYIKAGEGLQTGWYEFDKQPGTEQFRLIWAAQSAPEFEQFRRLVNNTDKGLISKPEDIKTLTEFLQQHPASQIPVNEDSQNKQINVHGREAILVALLELEHR
ncbi:MAG TPA: protein kinase [Blastocatellia bacterium]|nr:protein kinase [Blastocatellia bacterium]